MQTLKALGTGSVDVPPDTYGVTLEARAQMIEARDASFVVDEALRAAISRKTERVTISSSNFGTFPVRERSGQGVSEKIIGYECIGTLEVKAKSPGDLRNAVAAMTKDINVYVVGIQYELKDNSDAEIDAYARAVEDAKRTAKAMAQEANVQLKKILSISPKQESIGHYQRAQMFQTRESGRNFSWIPVVFVRIDVTANVEIVYEIGQGVPTAETRLPGVFFINIEEATLQNTYYRKVLHTTREQQLVVMSLEPFEVIPSEVHSDLTQFIRVESGKARVVIGNTEEVVNVHDVEADQSITIPSGTRHYILQIGEKPLKLYTVYSSGTGRFEHAPDRVDVRQPRPSSEDTRESEMSISEYLEKMNV